jgi:hypothetical protein
VWRLIIRVFSEGKQHVDPFVAYREHTSEIAVGLEKSTLGVTVERMLHTEVSA